MANWSENRFQTSSSGFNTKGARPEMLLDEKNRVQNSVVFEINDEIRVNPPRNRRIANRGNFTFRLAEAGTYLLFADAPEWELDRRAFESLVDEQGICNGRQGAAEAENNNHETGGNLMHGLAPVVSP